MVGLFGGLLIFRKYKTLLYFLQVQLSEHILKFSSCSQFKRQYIYILLER